MKENGFKLAKESRRYPAQTIMDVDYADDIVLLANTPSPSRNPAISSGTSSCWHRPPRQRRQDGIHVL